MRRICDETWHYYRITDFHMFFATVYGVSRAGVWRYCSQSADCADCLLRLYAGGEDRALIGFFCGLLVDIFFASVIGFYALLYMYIGYMNGKFAAIFYPQDIKLPVALILCSDFLYGIGCYVILFLLRGRFEFTYYLLHIILPEIVYTIAVTLLLYPLILWINTGLERSELRSGKKFV